MIDFEARREARGYLQESRQDNGDYDLEAAIAGLELPDVEGMSGVELTQVANTFKPHFYACIAVLTDKIVNATLADQTDYPPYGFCGPGFTKDSNKPFDELCLAMRLALMDHYESLSERHNLSRYQAFALFMRKVMPERHRTLEDQINGGVDTAVFSMVELLQSFPLICKRVLPQSTPTDWARLARASTQLPARQAMLGLDSFNALDDRLKANPADGADLPMLNPEGFCLIESPDGKQRIDYKGFEALSETELESQFQHAIRMGCPVTLLPKQLNNLWQLAINPVEGEGLWGNAA